MTARYPRYRFTRRNANRVCYFCSRFTIFQAKPSDVLSGYFFMIGSKDLPITDALELSRHLIAAPLPHTAATICERAVRATVRIGTTKCTSQEELHD